MRWKKLGQIFRPSGQREWMQSHASCPIALQIAGDLYRIYFGTRDAANRPRIGFVEVDITDPLNVLAVSGEPALDPGPWGHFDDNGVYPGCIVKMGSAIRMYYPGRSNGVPPLYYMGVGLAESRDGGRTFERLSPAPILGRGHHDPWMVTTPWVLRDEAGWRMWYASGIGWRDLQEKSSLYHIKYAESRDGLTWHRDGRVAVDLAPTETNIASPCVLPASGGFHMWYCYGAQGRGYRLGFARSGDGLVWQRDDAGVGILPSESGWDSDCMAYPFVFAHNGQLHLLYSGNGNGRDGFGLAVADVDG